VPAAGRALAALLPRLRALEILVSDDSQLPQVLDESSGVKRPVPCALLLALVRPVAAAGQLRHLTCQLDSSLHYPYGELARILSTSGVRLQTLRLLKDLSHSHIGSPKHALGLAKLLRQQAPSLRHLHLHSLLHHCPPSAIQDPPEVLPQLIEALRLCTGLYTLRLQTALPVSRAVDRFRRVVPAELAFPSPLLSMTELRCYSERSETTGNFLLPEELAQVAVACPRLQHFSSDRTKLSILSSLLPTAAAGTDLDLRDRTDQLFLSESWLQPELQHLDLSCASIEPNESFERVARLPCLRSLVVRDFVRPSELPAALLILRMSYSLRTVALACRREQRAYLVTLGVASAMLKLERKSLFRIRCGWILDG
jgi:hypothetical protein